LSCKTVFLTV